MDYSKQNLAKNYIIVGASLAALGATKGLITGLYRTHQREVNDGGPSIHTKDNIVGVIGSTGIIVSATTLLGTFEGGMVGLLWPLNLSWGIYQYIRNQYYNEQQEEEEEELVMADQLVEDDEPSNDETVNDTPFINLNGLETLSKEKRYPIY